MSLRRAGSICAAVLVLAAGAGVVAADRAASRPAAPQDATRTVTVPPGTLTVVCPGGPELGTEPAPGETTGPSAGTSPSATPTPTATGALPGLDPTRSGTSTSVTAVGRAGDGPAETSLELLGTEPSPVGTASTGTDASVLDGVRASGPTTLTVRPDGAAQAAAGALASSVTASGDLRGLAVAGCTSPATTLYLVGGATQVGSSARLWLLNPGATAVTADVTVLGADGEVETHGTSGVVVPAGGGQTLVLEGIAPGLGRMAVQVTTRGGEVAAYMQDSRMQDLTPQGVDVVVPTTPAETTWVTGIHVPDDKDVDAPLLRLVDTGRRATTADVTLTGPDGPVDLPGLTGIALDGRSVTDVSLAGLAPGTYTAEITAPRPVAAAVLLNRVGTGSTPPLERAWSAGQTPADQGLLALPGGTSAALSLAAADGAQVEVRGLRPDGTATEARTLTLEKGTTVTRAVADLVGQDVPALSYTVVSGSPVALAAVASVDQEDGTLIGVVLPRPVLRTDRTVQVQGR